MHWGDWKQLRSQDFSLSGGGKEAGLEKIETKEAGGHLFVTRE